MATFSEDFYDMDFVGIPCEFCGELFPLELVVEHQTGCRPDLVHFQPSDNEDNESDVISLPTPVQKTTSIKNVTSAPVQKGTGITNTSVPKETSITSIPLPKETSKTAPKLNSPNKQSDSEMSMKEKVKADLRSKCLIKDILASEKPALAFEDSMMQDKGPKMMTYGSSLNKYKIEEEKPSFKVPSLPLLNNADYKESENMYHNLSDSDDAEESLEDFWKKAEIQLSRRIKEKINI